MRLLRGVTPQPSEGGKDRKYDHVILSTKTQFPKGITEKSQEFVRVQVIVFDFEVTHFFLVVRRVQRAVC
jgi:hypothetical protein